MFEAPVYAHQYAEIARRAREAILAIPGFARWCVPRCARAHRSLGPTVRIRLPPAVSPVRTTGCGATFAMGRVARREMILRSKRYSRVDRVVCSMALDTD